MTNKEKLLKLDPETELNEKGLPLHCPDDYPELKASPRCLHGYGRISCMDCWNKQYRKYKKGSENDGKQHGY